MAQDRNWDEQGKNIASPLQHSGGIKMDTRL